MPRTATPCDAPRLNDLLTAWLPCRIDAIRAMLWALELRGRVRPPAPVELTVAGGMRFRGNVGLLTNAMIEVGYVHVGALLKFLGIAARNGSLVNSPRTAGDDCRPLEIAIEHYAVNGRHLDRITLDRLYAAIDLPRAVVEWIIVAIIETTSDCLGHGTKRAACLREVDQHVAVVGEAILSLLKAHVYDELEPGRYDRYRAPAWAAHLPAVPGRAS